MLDRLRHDPVLCRRVVVGTVVLAALTVRLLAIVGWAQHVLPAGDEAFYWRQAGYLAAGDGFVYRNNLGELVPTAVHPPLYSGVLGVVALLGVEDHVPFRLVGALIGAATAGVVALVALRLAGWRAGLVAGLIAAVQPNLWFNDVKLTAESVFALAVALVLCASYRLVDRPSTWNTSLLATTIGVAALARAEALLLYPLLLVPLVWRDAASPWRARLLRAAWGLAVVVVVIAPWVVRNATTFERPVALSSGAGFVLEISNCDQTYGLAPPVGDDGAPQGGTDASTFLGYWARDCDRSDRLVHGEAARPWPPGDETAAEADKRSVGLSYMRDNVGRLPVVVAARVGRIWDVWRPSQSVDFNVFFERRDATSTVAGQVVRWQQVGLWLHLGTLVAGVAGGIVLWRRRVTIVPFVALAISATVTAAVSFGITRYRIGADVGLIVLAGIAVSAGWQRVRA